ncbi:MAG TPA: class I SAM-dependent methyltransferase [Candidatus Merdivicinus intestinigallinarum]|nr:class I SAM-dependent methyltransferase [Candidatus Merdivicinus intestinigallinarum]
MRIAADWEGYEMLDTSGGEKLERWGNVFLIRPDPQIIWNTPKEHPMWKKAHAHYFRSEKGGGHWETYQKTPDNWALPYRDLKFKISPTGFKHTGLFPEQAVNWDLFRKLIGEAGRPVSVLNLFAYTGGATLACAAAGASVCHVDASKGMVAWAKENAALSGLSDRPIRWIVDDCEKFVAREIRRGRRYDAIIMDPPSYGRGPGGEVWKLEDSIYGLVELCSQVLSEKPLFVALNSYTTGLSPSVMAYLLGATVGKQYQGFVTADEIGLPVTASGQALPCGSTALWSEKPLELL